MTTLASAFNSQETPQELGLRLIGLCDKLTNYSVLGGGFNISGARKLIASGADVTVQDKNGMTALMFAAQITSDCDLLDILLAAGADPCKGDDLGQAPLHFAAESGNVEALRRLHDAGADIDRRTRNGETPLLAAVRRGEVESACMLLNHGADPFLKNDDGEGIEDNPMMFERSAGMKTLVESTIRDTRQKPCRPYSQQSPQELGHLLIEMVRKKKADQAEVVNILAWNPDLSVATGDGDTALHFACARAHAEIAVLLLDKNPPLDRQNSTGDTPLMIACGNRHLRVQAALKMVQLGASSALKNRSGQNVRDILLMEGALNGMLGCTLLQAIQEAEKKKRQRICNDYIDKGLPVAASMQALPRMKVGRRLK